MIALGHNTDNGVGESQVNDLIHHGHCGYQPDMVLVRQSASHLRTRVPVPRWLSDVT
jgi:hypothetical protein